jgi:hypothetical protein
MEHFLFGHLFGVPLVQPATSGLRRLDWECFLASFMAMNIMASPNIMFWLALPCTSCYVWVSWPPSSASLIMMLAWSWMGGTMVQLLQFASWSCYWQMATCPLSLAAKVVTDSLWFCRI